MNNKLNKTEKIKRLKKLSTLLNKRNLFMCIVYLEKNDNDLFEDIPELLKFRPKFGSKQSNSAWCFLKTKNDVISPEIYIKKKKECILNCIKLLQSK